MRKSEKKVVGFIGLGRMGKPMATNILKAGYPLIVFDTNKEPLVEMSELGAQVATSTNHLGRDSDVVIAMVINYEQIKEVLFSREGALNGMKKGSTLIIMSTISPLDAKEVGEKAREKSIIVLDSPVSGGIQAAKAGTLNLIVGGATEVVNDNEDILKAMGQKINHVGDFGTGELVKMINQLMAIAGTVATAEAAVMAEKLGVNLETLYDVVTNSSGDCWAFRNRVPKIIKRDFTAEGNIEILIKDSGIVVNTAMALGIPLPVSTAANQILKTAGSRGLSQLHPAALINLYEEFGQFEEHS